MDLAWRYAPRSTQRIKSTNEWKITPSRCHVYWRKREATFTSLYGDSKTHCKYKEIDLSKYPEAQKMGVPIWDYDKVTHVHYHEFVDACLGKDICSAPFPYSGRLSETILLGVIAGQFPNKKLYWDSKKGSSNEPEANQFLDCKHRVF